MDSLPSAVPGVLGNTSLGQFDAIIIGSGAGGSTAARTLTVVGGRKVLVLEAGPNYFIGLDDPAPNMPAPLYSNDELKLSERGFIGQDPFLEPRTFRTRAAVTANVNEDVNTLPRTVGGAAVHADMKLPRLNVVDFRLASEFRSQGLDFPGTNFADWPLSYDELEPFYTDVERLIGVQGQRGSDPFASPRSTDFVMPPGVPMYVALVLRDGARANGYTPFPFPTGITSRPYRGRPPCIDCGFCAGYGCPINSKSSPAVTALREALLTGNCQVRFNCMVTRLLHDRGQHVTGVEYVDADGNRQQATADQFILAASTIESARLCLLSDLGGPGLGNSSGLVGRNLMFHFQTIAVGIFKQRFHGERGRAVTHGISDFRGVLPGGERIDPRRKLGGIIEFGTNSEAITEAKSNVQALALTRFTGSKITLKQLLLNSPLRARLAALEMQAEDAPQRTNQIDLDPRVRDVFGLPVPRITYANSRFESDAREFYSPKLLDVLKAAGAQFGFIAPADSPSQSRHIMGTLRMGNDPQTSVCDRFGKFHDVDNLYCMDGGVFVTSSGYNPTLTITALALRAASNLISPRSPERALGS
ncbi:MAG: GMC family oxidoreductase [Candidatus Binatia bacterium]